MYRLYEPLYIALQNFRELLSNKLALISSMLIIIFCGVTGVEYVKYAQILGKPIQIFEPFIAVFTNRFSLILLSLFYMVIFNNIPAYSKVTSYYMIRTTKQRWFIGQVIFVIITLVLLMMICIITTTVVGLKYAFIQNIWSDTSFFVVNSLSEFNINILALINSDPYLSIMHITALQVVYGLFIATIFMLFNIIDRKIIGLVITGIVSLSNYIYTFQMFDFTKEASSFLNMNYINFLNSYINTSIVNVYIKFTLIIATALYICSKLNKFHHTNFKNINKGVM